MFQFRSCQWRILIFYIYAFSRRFYPKWLTVHSGYTVLYQYMCFLGIEPTTFALLTQCSTTEPQEHIWAAFLQTSHSLTSRRSPFPRMQLKSLRSFIRVFNTSVMRFLCWPLTSCSRENSASKHLRSDWEKTESAAWLNRLMISLAAEGRQFQLTSLIITNKA